MVENKENSGILPLMNRCIILNKTNLVVLQMITVCISISTIKLFRINCMFKVPYGKLVILKLHKLSRKIWLVGIYLIHSKVQDWKLYSFRATLMHRFHMLRLKSILKELDGSKYRIKWLLRTRGEVCRLGIRNMMGWHCTLWMELAIWYPQISLQLP